MFLLDVLFRGLAFVVLGLLEMMGSKRASKWLDSIMRNAGKSEKPVV